MEQCLHFVVCPAVEIPQSVQSIIVVDTFFLVRLATGLRFRFRFSLRFKVYRDLLIADTCVVPRAELCLNIGVKAVIRFRTISKTPSLWEVRPL